MANRNERPVYPQKSPDTMQTILAGIFFSPFPYKPHTERHTAQQGANIAAHMEMPLLSSSS